MIKIYNRRINTRPLDIQSNFYKALRAVSRAKRAKADLIVFPRGFLSGADCGALENARWARDIYDRLVRKLSLVAGKIHLLADSLPSGYPSPVFYYDGEPVSSDNIEIGGVKVQVTGLGEIPDFENLPGADLYILNDTSPVKAGERTLLKASLARLSKFTGRRVDVNMGGWGRTSHPSVYMPSIGFFSPDGGDMTPDLTSFHKANLEYFADKKGEGDKTTQIPDFYLSFVPCQNPMIPANLPEKDYCLDLFNLQTRALASRLDNLNMKSAVVALSGGLDSRLALLVTVNAFDLLGLDRKGIKVITMPGFGTSGTTRSLAGQLASSLGLPLDTVDITSSCLRALKDIGHDGRTPDVTFENVQARMRTLYALSIANALGGIMVGTGDLSEEALGFSTYGGDRLASYNVNSSVSKTVIRAMLPYVTALGNLSRAKEAIEGILNIPVSPELVPHGGEILQKTEEILAPYKLVDFYTFCFIILKDSPSAMAKRAKGVFGEEFSAEYLEEKAKMYCRRFISGQFKRSCSPEGAALTHFRLTGYDRSLPSDGTTGFFDEDFEGEE